MDSFKKRSLTLAAALLFMMAAVIAGCDTGASNATAPTAISGNVPTPVATAQGTPEAPNAVPTGGDSLTPGLNPVSTSGPALTPTSTK